MKLLVETVMMVVVVVLMMMNDEYNIDAVEIDDVFDGEDDDDYLMNY